MSHGDYDRALSVWDFFGCKSVGDYANVYLTKDVLLLEDVFEKFWRLCLKAYKIDPHIVLLLLD